MFSRISAMTTASLFGDHLCGPLNLNERKLYIILIISLINQSNLNYSFSEYNLYKKNCLKYGFELEKKVLCAACNCAQRMRLHVTRFNTPSGSVICPSIRPSFRRLFVILCLSVWSSARHFGLE